MPALAQPVDDAVPVAVAVTTPVAALPKPKMVPYGRNRPIFRLPLLLARHRDQPRWSEQVLLTPHTDAKWSQMAPGDKTPVQSGEARMVWVVWSGQIRFDIAGQAPFVATKGFVVQTPPHSRYSLQSIGDAPSLRFEVASAAPSQNDASPPMIDFFKDVAAAPSPAPQRIPVVSDAADRVTIVRAPGVPIPPAKERGTFNVGADQFWFILEGKCDYLIEDIGFLTANAGDIVFVPPGRLLRVSGANGQMDSRISFSPDADAAP